MGQDCREPREGVRGGDGPVDGAGGAGHRARVWSTFAEGRTGGRCGVVWCGVVWCGVKATVGVTSWT